jgi:3-oxoacyl-[acyl-carrier protein] reductase
MTPKLAAVSIDTLVNNAGVYTFSPTDSFSEEEFHREFNINVLGVLLSIREALKHFATKAAASSTLVRSSAASHHPKVQSMSPRKAPWTALADEGAWAEKYPCQRDQPRRGGDRGNACRWHHRR